MTIKPNKTCAVKLGPACEEMVWYTACQQPPVIHNVIGWCPEIDSWIAVRFNAIKRAWQTIEGEPLVISHWMIPNNPITT